MCVCMCVYIYNIQTLVFLFRIKKFNIDFLEIIQKNILNFIFCTKYYNIFWSFIK